MVTAGLLLGAYLVGSVPFGYLLLRVVRGVDVRSYGSHNIGAINVARAGGTWLGIATLLADVAKAMAVVLATHGLAMSASVVAAAALLVMLGHAYSLWFLLRDGRFAEGKSVACALGVMIGLACVGVLPWPLALTPLGLWIFGLIAPRALTGYWHRISPVTMAATVCIPVVVWVAHPARPYLALSLAMAALVLVRHRNNIRRLIAGTEPRLGQPPAQMIADGQPASSRGRSGGRSQPIRKLQTAGGGR